MKALLLVIMVPLVAAVADTNLVAGSQIQATNLTLKVEQFTAKVISKSADGVSIQLTDSAATFGGSEIGHSIINAGPGKPHKALGASGGIKLAQPSGATYLLVGHPNPTRLMIGSTITFKASRIPKSTTLTWVE